MPKDAAASEVAVASAPERAEGPAAASGAGPAAGPKRSAGRERVAGPGAAAAPENAAGPAAAAAPCTAAGPGIAAAPELAAGPRPAAVPEIGAGAEIADGSDIATSAEIAAAICYRWRRGRSQFLLVRTSDGARWTFPKGGVDTGETPAEAAAREADEEAGVSGVVADTLLTEYRHAPSRRAGNADDLVAAFLLEVLRAGAPCERGRDPTWFDVATARKSLAEGRDAFYAHELQRVLDVAARNVQRR